MSLAVKLSLDYDFALFMFRTSAAPYNGVLRAEIVSK